MDARETARLELQQRLDTAKTQTERNKLGQFATPTQLADEMIAYAEALLTSRSKINFLEPGFGTGPFYSALLRHVAPSRIEAAAGFEIDTHYAEPAKDFWKSSGLRLHISSFTEAEPPKTEAAKYNLIVCNPPYVRHHHLSQTQKRDLQAAVARHLDFEMNGLSGLYTYFVVLSQAWMSRDGVGAWLIPSEFMDVNYGRKVKEFLTEKVTLHRIHRFDPNEVQFGDALVSSAVVFFKNAPPPAEHEAEFTFGGTVTKPKLSDSIRLDDLRRISKWTGLPQDASRLIHRSNGSTLSDLFTIKRGLATGCNSFFVLTPDQVEQLKLPRKFLRPILPSPRELVTDEIPADEHGEPLIASRRYLLSCDLPERDVESEYPMLWRYLLRGIERKVNEGYICSHREPWYTQENRPPAPFLCTYMGRPTKRSESPFRFILNHSKATAANVYLMLYPKPVLAALLSRDVELHRTIWKGLSSITAETLKGEGRVYGGGLHKLEPKELANVASDFILNGLPRARELRVYGQQKLFAK
ncbi:MAG TPA: class I SAM-dependent methyltransferase [Blastocatellia bacterium]|nr:class I SAM-dependent methyltransferase [Blastocatellia bacterium]